MALFVISNFIWKHIDRKINTTLLKVTDTFIGVIGTPNVRVWNKNNLKVLEREGVKGNGVIGD